jgi:uncharacterized coiled-coil protein SlyX
LPKDDFYTPNDVDALRMENELLTFEVRFLKARLAESERAVAPLRNQLAETERRLEQAEADLTLLLRRLANSPLGPFLRIRQSFRTLERRYSGTDA